MANIFLSYSHEDSKRAEAIAEALHAAGHDVWWDRHIHAGSRFSKDIDAALKRADLVVVLWSKHSVDSPWVQDEAGHGRDKGQLVPVLIGKVDPPLGFRQYQSVQLGRSGADAVVGAVEERLSGAPAATSKSAGRGAPLWRRYQLVLGAIFLLAIVGASWWVVVRSLTASPAASIVVEPAEAGAPMAEMLARSIADELGRFRAGPLAGLDIRQNGGSANYRAKIGVFESPGKLTLELSLASRRAGNLWSGRVEGPPNQGAELDRQAAAVLGAALQCDLSLEKGRYSLAPEIRGLYVDGCARLADPRASPNETINAFRQVTQKAPRFGPGWAKLALAEFSGIDFVAESEKSNLAWTAGRHSSTARELDPNLPEIYYVRAFDRPWNPDSNAEALRLLDEGLHRNPDSALLHGGRADVLLRLGRIGEALESAKRATALNPLSPALLETYVLALAYAGQPKAAERELDTAESNWPRSAAIAVLRYMFDLRYGDPATALRMLKEDEVPDVTSDESTELFLRAREKPTEANINAALGSYKAKYEKSPFGVVAYVQALAQFGRADEAHRILAEAPVDPWYVNGEILFRPFMKELRADPRFVQLAYRAGLLSSWRKSGVWPDFCKDQRLRYDCREEAKKYPADPPKA